MTKQSEPGPDVSDQGAADLTDLESDSRDDSLTGSDSGSDTRAGSLRGGSATGSDIDPDQRLINESLARQGIALAAGKPGKG